MVIVSVERLSFSPTATTIDQVNMSNLNTTSTRNIARPGRIIAILGMLAAFAPMATDMYLAAFDLMRVHFGAKEGEIELTLSIFFLGLAFGQAVYGPIIDRFGRRVPLLVGIGIYLASTALFLVAQDLRAFIALRFLQAVGGSSGMIIGRAIIADMFDERENARALSLVIAVMTLAPVIAPVLGGIVISLFGWKSIFLVMLAFGAICAALTWRYIPETLAKEDRRAESPAKIAGAWYRLVTKPTFIAPAIVGGLAQGCMFAFITGSPEVFQTIHGATPSRYGLLFATIALALVISAHINRMALKYKTPEFLLGLLLLINALAGIGTIIGASTGNLVLLMIPLWVAIGSIGFIGANAAAIAMESSTDHAGSGSSLIGIMQFGVAFLVSTGVAMSQNGTAYPMTIAIATCGLLANAVWRVSRRGDTASRRAAQIPIGSG